MFNPDLGPVQNSAKSCPKRLSRSCCCVPEGGVITLVLGTWREKKNVCLILREQRGYAAKEMTWHVAAQTVNLVFCQVGSFHDLGMTVWDLCALDSFYITILCPNGWQACLLTSCVRQGVREEWGIAGHLIPVSSPFHILVRLWPWLPGLAAISGDASDLAQWEDSSSNKRSSTWESCLSLSTRHLHCVTSNCALFALEGSLLPFLEYSSGNQFLKIYI